MLNMFFLSYIVFATFFREMPFEVMDNYVPMKVYLDGEGFMPISNPSLINTSMKPSGSPK